MKVKELFEMSPQNTFAQDFGLEDPKNNEKHAREYLRSSKKVPIESFQDGTYTLYEYPRAFVLIDHRDNDHPQIAYIVKFKTEFYRFLGRKCAQQFIIWRNTKDYITINLAKNIFFDKLLHNYDTMITDGMQTADGRRFWDIRITEALQLGVLVYYINLLPNREITQIHNDIEYRNLVANKEIWGDAQKHQGRRLVITTKEFK